jgi:hypothetical protein
MVFVMGEFPLIVKFVFSFVYEYRWRILKLSARIHYKKMIAV